MTELNTWMPVDASNPIPMPENERQVLWIYEPSSDNDFWRNNGRPAYHAIKAKLATSPQKQAKQFATWDGNWFKPMHGDKNGPLFIYNKHYFKDAQYLITEVPPITAPTVSGEDN